MKVILIVTYLGEVGLKQSFSRVTVSEFVK